MKLADLAPRMEEHGYLSFDCPLGHAHRICIPTDRTIVANAWARSGELPDTLSLSPSIHAHSARPNDDSLRGEEYRAAAACGWHGFITNGDVTNA